MAPFGLNRRLPYRPPFVVPEGPSDAFKDAGRTWRVMNPFAVGKARGGHGRSSSRAIP